jgi:rhodanese-related sulfurtransferase
MVDLIAIESIKEVEINLPLCLKVPPTLLTQFATLVFISLIATITTLPLTASAQVALLFGDLSWARINSYLDKDYPTVANISTKELAQLLTQPGEIILLDARNADEFDASHIAKARRYDGAAAFINTLPKDAAIVVYCSVGVRSASIAKQLNANGYSNVKNLRGSIFMWANEGRPLVGQAAPKVHPFNARWGALLDPALHFKK